MTLIDTKVDFWTESFFGTDTVIAAGVVKTQIFPLRKAGRFAGGWGFLYRDSGDHASSVVLVADDSSQLNYGDVVTGVQCISTNQDTGASSMKFGAIVFLKK